DALHRLSTHQRSGEAGVEPVFLGRVRAEPGRDAARSYLDDPADRVALLARLVDPRPQSVLVDDAPLDADLDRPEQGLRHGTGCDVDRRVPRGRPLERVADVGVTVLQHAGEVGMTRP